MKKALKGAAIAGVILAVLFGICTVALHILLPPEKAKARVLGLLTSYLKREVQMGDVSVGLISGLDIANLKISEAPDFSRGTFVSSDHFSIKVALLPLLFRKIELKQLALIHPVINVTRFQDGKTFNFSDLIPASSSASVPTTAGESRPSNPFAISEAHAAPAAGGVPPQEKEAAFALLVSNAEIKNGIVRFVDRSAAKQSMDVDPLHLKLKNASLTSPFSVQASLKAKARGVIAALKVAGDADLPTGSFKIKNCELSSGGSTLTLAGKASQLKSDQPLVDLTLDIKELKAATLAPFMALPPALKLEGPILGKARVKGDRKKMDVSVSVDLEKVNVVYAGQFAKPPRVPMGISLRGGLTDLQTLDATEFKAVLGSLQLAGHGKVLAVTSEQPQFNFHMESNAFPVNELAGFTAAALPAGLVLKGRAQIAADASGTQTSSHFAAKFDGKELDVTMGDKFKKSPGVPFRLAAVGEWVQSVGRTPRRNAAQKPASAGERHMNFPSLKATLGSVELSGSGSMRTAGPSSKIQLAMKSNSFSVQEVSKMAPLLADYRLAGTASTEVRASGPAEAPQVQGSLALQDVSMRYQRSELARVSTTLTFTEEDVSIPKLTGRLNGSEIGLKVVGRRLRSRPDVHVEASIAELDLAKLLPPLQAAPSPSPAPSQQGGLRLWVAEAWAAAPPAVSPPAKLSGHLTVGHIKHEYYDARELDFKWNLTDVTPDLSTVNGTAGLKQGPGKLKELEKLASMSKSARLALLPILTLQKLEKNGIMKGLGLPSLQTISFSGIHGDYGFRSGVMDIKTFEMTGQDLNLNTTGTIGLAGAQPLDVRVMMKLAAGALGGTLGQLMKDESGRASLAFTARGTVSNPAVKLDMTEASRKAVQQVGEQLLKGLGLGGGRKQAPPANAAPGSLPDAPAAPAEDPASPPPQAVDELEKAFKNIFR